MNETHEVLMRIWSNWNSLALMVGMHNSTGALGKVHMFLVK